MKRAIIRSTAALALVATTLVTGLTTAPASAGPNANQPEPVRFATFNASLNRFNAGDLVVELAAPDSAQPATIAEIIQTVRPEVLLINEFDFDPDALDLFRDNYR